MYCFRPIGYARVEASREEVKASYDGVEGYIELLQEYEDGLRGLEGFSHIILITYLHETTEEQRKVLVVRPRRLVKFGLKLEELPEIGVFASDSPHRPNPIGLHIVRLKYVEGRKLYVSGLDVFDGTPVLDIKPYTISRIINDASFPKWYRELRKRVGHEV
ncbi:MAG: tRNA (N6-threonylcarbamoyladenosine(37)-N6)-methyltransferase TrmO [Thermoproteota archaeon]|nr:MAG: tRNA (N6-threonylcarbamoyladenosine(37)-N6)-methyltransferase TrmO [Candidatus Korarchaeota archaeon]